MTRRESYALLEALESRTLFSEVSTAGDKSLHITVFNDINGNGAREASEPLLTGWNVSVTRADGTSSDRTADNGQYVYRKDIDDVTAINVDLPSGWRLRIADSIETVRATYNTTFGYTYHAGVTQRAALSGYVFNDANANAALDAGESTLPGWQVYTDDNDNGQYDDGERLVLTNASGKWSLPTLPPGHDFRIRTIAKFALEQTVPSGGAFIVHLDKGQVAKRSFGVRSAIARGQVYNDLNANSLRDADEYPIAGWRVWADVDGDSVYDINEPSALTGADGAWQINELPAGKYRIRAESRSAWPATQNATGVQINAVAGQATDGIAFGQQGIVIAGTVYHDGNGDHARSGKSDKVMTGALVYLDLNNNGGYTKGEPQVTTSASGRFVFADQSAGSYRVRARDIDGFFQTTPTGGGARSVTASAGQIIGGRDFGFQLPVRIVGRVFSDNNGNGIFDASDEPLSNVGVFADLNGDGVRDTDEHFADSLDDGSYEIQNLLPGSYTIRLDPNEDSFVVQDDAPTASAFASGSITTADVSLARQGVSGKLFIDGDGDGAYHDATDLPLSFDVVLQGPHGFTPQALHGPSFRLGNLPNGHYTLIAGSSPYYPGGRVSKTTAIATWGSDRFEFDIDADHQHITHDFLYTNLVGGLSGQVFVDTNKNGIRDAGEVGGHDHVKNIYIDANNNGKRDANEPVAFRGNSNNPQPNGDFWFSRVAPAGNYIMRIELESGWKLQAPQGGSYNRTLNGGQTRDDHYFAIVPA